MKKILILVFILVYGVYAKDKTILFLGDSLTEGLGVSKEEAYPSLVEKMIKTKLKKDVKIINGGVSGSTTSDGLSRLKWYMKRKPDMVFLALGANDGLRGLELKKSEQNLEEIIIYAQKHNAKVLLAGMLMPPNYGLDYSNSFKKMYENLKEKYDLQTLPFLLEGVAGVQGLNQRDGIHPNVEGHKIIAKNIFEFLKGKL